jgi:4-amino-4-deoxy-L-arabinose transferase-like glycosyltransferase
VAAILAAFLCLGTLYAVLTPAWQVPDEPAHYNYVRYLVAHRRLPELQMGDYDQAYLNQITEKRFPPDWSIDSIRYEYHQPPLYYLLLAPVYVLFGGALLPLRLCSVLLAGGSVLTSYYVVKTVLPARSAPALGTAAFVAFIPQHIALSAGVENDALAELILALILLQLTRWLRAQAPVPRRWTWVTGFLIGLGLLTKLSTYVSIPLLIAAAALKHWPPRTEARGGRFALRPALRSAVLVLLLAALIGLPWFARNVVVYGGLDWNGLARHEQVVQGQLRTSEWIQLHGWRALPGSFLRTSFRSFWAKFGWMAVPVDWRIYTTVRALSAIAAVGFVFRVLDVHLTLDSTTKSLLMLLCSGLLTLAAYLWYNLGFYQAQGRYLFTALIPLGVAWTLGLEEALRPHTARWVTALMAAVAAYDLLPILRGGGDKWKLLIHSAATGFAGLPLIVSRRWRWWLLSLPYLSMALLCAVSPFWFIVPHLTP